ncbi:unnamed protein product [Rhodiola kirilowii]
MNNMALYCSICSKV